MDFCRIRDRFVFHIRRLNRFCCTCCSIFIFFDSWYLIETVATRLIEMVLVFGSFEATVFAETPVIFARRVVGRRGEDGLRVNRAE